MTLPQEEVGSWKRRKEEGRVGVGTVLRLRQGVGSSDS